MAMTPLSAAQRKELRERGLGIDGRELVEHEARRLVQGERDQAYDNPRGNFKRIALMWSAIFGIEVTEEQVAIAMAAVKLARLAYDPKAHDSQVDVIGYIICLNWLQEPEPITREP